MAETIAQAYVQILPSTEGIQGQLTNLLGGEADKAGASAGSRLGNAFKTGLAALGTASVAGVTAASTALVKVGKDALSTYADYEQLVGGVETLFKDSADVVMQYADNAYKTAGLSANQYMETVTSFSAALIQSTGRGAQQDLAALEETLDAEYTATKRSLEDQYDALKDSWDERIRLTKDQSEKASLRSQRDQELKDLNRANEDELAALKKHNADLLAEAEAANSASVTTEESLAKAAELADMAITDMADNANKMGSSMESIQEAYQGFSKQNYTMLDNLKLGYGGTKSEMERLLADAAAISGVEYDISSLSDVYEAIHVIQTELGITGTTAEEASQTISGSLAAMKSSWANLLVGIADENANMDDLVNNFVDSVLTVGDNLMPRVEQILGGLSTMIEKLSETLLPVVIDALVSHAPQLLQSGLMIVETLGQAIISNLPALVAAASDIIMTLTSDLISAAPDILEAGFSIIISLADSLIQALPELIPALVDVILTIVEKLTEPDTLMMLVDVAFQLIGAVAMGLIEAIPKLIEKAPEIIKNLVEAIIRYGGQLVESGKTLISKLGEGIRDAAGKAVEAFGRVWDSIKETVGGWIDKALQWGRDLIQKFVDGILERWDRFKGRLEGIGSWLGDTFGVSNNEMGSVSELIQSSPLISNAIPDSLNRSELQIRRQLTSTLALSDELRQMTPTPAGTQPAGQASGTGAQSGHKQITVILQLDRATLGRAVYQLNDEETQRVGVKLALTGGAA